MKTAYGSEVERLERGGVGTIGKQHFTSLYSPARKRAFTPKNIKAGSAATGMFPFNPDRVLRSMPKPPSQLIIPTPHDEVVEARTHAENLPRTPVTPMSESALNTLQDFIIERDAYALDEINKENLNRHVQKLKNAAGTALAKSAIQNE